MAVTHFNISKKLGINRTTVTKALKGDLSIKRSTRKKVMETAAMMGYDFKQSQRNNRREGKRYYAHEEVSFSITTASNRDLLLKGRGLLTNLSTTGTLMQLKSIEGDKLPCTGFEVSIRMDEAVGSMDILPLARVLRITYHGSPEWALKFEHGAVLALDILEDIENRSFKKIGKEKGEDESEDDADGDDD